MANKRYKRIELAKPHGKNHLKQTKPAPLTSAELSELVMTAFAENAQRASETGLRAMTKDDFDLLLNSARAA